MNKLLSFAIGLIIINQLTAYAQQSVKGFVYEDLNKNSIKDKGERGIAGVAVSNGQDVVLTGSKGEYQLAVSDDNIIFVIKSSEYTVPVDENNAPLFYYIHKPKGSPKLKFEGVSPTGKLNKAVNFPLFPITKKEDFKILVFGDPQPRDEKEIDYFSKGIVDELKNTKDAEFGITLGDLAWDNLNLQPQYKQSLRAIGIPWYNVMGNHDINYDVTSDSLSDETYEKNFGPNNFAFNHGSVHFIILDDILYPHPVSKSGYWGGFRKEQLDFVENDLKYVPKDKLIVLAFHIPLTEPIGEDPFRNEDRDRLFEILKDFPYTLSVSAHTHYQSQDFFNKEMGWRQEEKHHHLNVGTTCGDWHSGRLNDKGVPVSRMRDGTPKGYGYLTFNKNKYYFDYKVAGKAADYRFEIYAPKVVEYKKGTSAGIYANFFIGSKYDQVFCRIDQGDWTKMRYVLDYDPSFLHQLHEWDFTEVLFEGWRPSNPVKCNHLWRSPIPTGIEPGEHIIEIKATDMFGRTFTQKSSYKIIKPDSK